MKVIVTGAAGFVGSRIADVLLSKDSLIRVTELILTDTISPPKRDDPRVTTLALDLANPINASQLIGTGCDVILHLAAVVSGTAEQDFELGMKVNLDATRYLLEAVRHKSPTAKFVFASSVAVYGGDLPTVVQDSTAVTPQTSYGTAKAMCELLVNDYTRRGFVDGCSVRLPAVSVRAGAPNTALSSFVSGIIREPLNGVPSVCPVSPETNIWLTSPATVAKNIIYGATLPKSALGLWHTVNLPGITVTVGEMIAALKTVAGEKVASLISFKFDKTVDRFMDMVPKRIDNTRALKLGFTVDANFEDVIRIYIQDEMK